MWNLSISVFTCCLTISNKTDAHCQTLYDIVNTYAYVNSNESMHLMQAQCS